MGREPVQFETKEFEYQLLSIGSAYLLHDNLLVLYI